jgi:Fe-S cluster assembly iron-binding protein IscA
MFNATETAVSNLRSYLDVNNIQAGIRITCRHGKRLKPGLGIVFGNANENDRTFELDGVQFVINQELLQKSGGITLDYINQGVERGYSVTPSNSSETCAH